MDSKIDVNVEEKKKHWLEELSDEATLLKVDGLPNIIRSRNLVIKVAWAILLVVSLCVCVMLITGSVKEYLHYEVTTTTRLTQDNQATFPVVTICPINPLATEFSAQLAANTSKTPYQSDSLDIVLDIEKAHYNRTGSYLTEADKRRFTDLDSNLVSCKIGNSACNASQFQWVWHPSLGGCYRFNSGFNGADEPVPLIKSDVAGSAFSLEIELYAGLPDYWSDAIGQYGQRGFNIFVHNQTDYPYNLTPSPILLTPGFGIEISLQRSFYSQYNKWPYAYSECRVDEENELMGSALTDPELFEEVAKAGYSYSRSTCISYCAQLETTKACKCNSYNIEWQVPEYETCLTSEETACANRFFNDEFIVNGFIENNCLPLCPLECSQRTLSTTLVYFTYPNMNDTYRTINDERMKTLHAKEKDFATMEILIYNLVKFSLYYETLAYTIAEEDAEMSMDSLIGTLGGHLHLFLGMSLLSFIELVEIFIIAIALRLEHKQNDAVPKKNTPEDIKENHQPVQVQMQPQVPEAVPNLPDEKPN